MSQSQVVREKQEIGLPVTDFSLRQIGGETRDLGSFLEGRKGAAVVFWSGVCSHCVRYDAYFNRFTDLHPEYSFVAIASRHGETAEQIAATAKERGLTFPIVHDPGGVVARQWYTQQTPRAFLIDANARTLLYRGAVDNYKLPEDSDYQAYLEPAIAQFNAGEPITKNDIASFGCAIMSVYYILPKPLA